MKRLLISIAACLVALFPLAAQESSEDKKIDRDGIELTSGSKTELKLHVAFPMYFGETALLGVNYKGPWAGTEYGNFLDTKLYQNFVYNLEMAGLHMTSKKSPLIVSLGLRWSFMDFSLSDTSVTFDGSESASSVTYLPTAITAAGYDGKKSKIHASYIGVPLRLAVKIGDKGKVFAGVAGEYLVKGYAKYRAPRTRTTTDTLFSPWRASVEGGVSYAGIGIWVSYGLTPLFPSECSDARTLSFGLTLGL